MPYLIKVKDLKATRESHEVRANTEARARARCFTHGRYVGV